MPHATRLFSVNVNYAKKVSIFSDQLLCEIV